VTVVDIQFSAAVAEWATLRSAAVEAERRGFGAVWVFDHLAGASLDGTTMLECFALLGALAEATSTIELGVMVANVWNRQAGTLVASAASVASISGRPFHLGVGAGASPHSKWSAEQHAVGAYVEADLAERHRRVEEVLDLSERQWRADREDIFATVPLPSPVPSRIVGVNSVALAQIAGRRADGVNVAWHHARRDELVTAALAAAGDRPFSLTVWTRFDPELLDDGHPERRAMARSGVDRVLLTEFGPPRL
jgi:alkanesulfonate monooxygenase SsuD/methylene tetrahydromethanopterin reductase-like flavin-dependent oxidoreductase (luciferase family)